MSFKTSILMTLTLLATLPIVGGCAFDRGINGMFMSSKPSPEEVAAQAKFLADAQAAEEKRQKDFAEALAKCEKMPWAKNTAFEKQNCLNKAQEPSVTQRYGTTLAQAIFNANSKAALDYSEGKISQQRFLLTKDEILLKVDSYQEEKKRLADIEQNRIYNANMEAERQRKAAAWQQFGQAMQQQQLLNQNQQIIDNQNRMRTTNCNAFGNNLNCTTF